MTLDEMKAKAFQIQDQINTILGQIDPNEFDEDAVNWGDICCTDVSVSLMDGTWCATIEEASPNSTNLTAYLHNELTRFGHDVWVRCEW